MTESPPENISRSYRLPEDILEWIQRRTKDTCRSENAEVVYLLKEAKKKDREYA